MGLLDNSTIQAVGQARPYDDVARFQKNESDLATAGLQRKSLLQGLETDKQQQTLNAQKIRENEMTLKATEQQNKMLDTVIPLDTLSWNNPHTTLPNGQPAPNMSPSQLSWLEQQFPDLVMDAGGRKGISLRNSMQIMKIMGENTEQGDKIRNGVNQARLMDINTKATDINQQITDYMEKNPTADPRQTIKNEAGADIPNPNYDDKLSKLTAQQKKIDGEWQVSVQMQKILDKKYETNTSTSDTELFMKDPKAYAEKKKIDNTDKAPSAIQEYEYAVKQGFKGTFADYEKSMKQAGATNITLNTEKKMWGKVAEVVGENVANVSKAAQDATKTINAAHQIKGALDSGGVTAGPTATWIMVGKQVANMMGFTGDKAVENTRNVIQGMAKLALGARATLKGQGQISDYEGKLLQRAESGEINELTVPEIRIVADVAERASRLTIKLNNTNVEQIKKNPEAATLVPFLNVQEPPEYVSPVQTKSKFDKFMK